MSRIRLRVSGRIGVNGIVAGSGRDDRHIGGNRAIVGVQGRDHRLRLAFWPQGQKQQIAMRHHGRIQREGLRHVRHAAQATHDSYRDGAVEQTNAAAGVKDAAGGQRKERQRDWSPNWPARSNR